ILVFYISAPPPPALSPLSLTTLFRSRLCRNIGPYRLRSTGDLQYRCEARSQSDFFICGAALRAGSEMRLNLQLLISRELLMVVSRQLPDDVFSKHPTLLPRRRPGGVTASGQECDE